MAVLQHRATLQRTVFFQHSLALDFKTFPMGTKPLINKFFPLNQSGRT